jgi:YbbR domain-containing protein
VFPPKPTTKLEEEYMKKTNLISIAAVFTIALFLMLACNASTANMSSLKTSTDKEGKSETSKFKNGDTLYGAATISNNPGKVKVKLYLVDSKGETLKGSEVTVDIPGDGVASYNVPVSEAFPAGTYKLNADMLNEAGEKKDSKSVSVTIEGE